MSTGPQYNDYVIPQIVGSDPFSTWLLRTNTDIIGKLNLMSVYGAQGISGIDVSVGSGGIALISLGATIDGDHTFTGNITFNGSVTTINSIESTIDDYNLVLGDTNGGSGSNDTDIGNSGGGGIIVRGASGDKSILWSLGTDGTTNNSGWNVNQNIILGATRAIMAADNKVRIRGATGGLIFGMTANGSSSDTVTVSYGMSAGDEVEVLRVNPDTTVTIRNGVNNKRVYQVSHGFTFGSVVRFNPTTSGFTAAKADTAGNAEVIGVVSGVNGSTFDVTFLGEISGSFNSVNIAGTTLNPGECYFLSGSTAGMISTTPPSTVGYVRKPILIATGYNSALVVHFVGAENVDEQTLNGSSSTQKFYFVPGATQSFEVGTAVQCLSAANATLLGVDYYPASAATDEESLTVGIVTNITASGTVEVTSSGIVTLSGITLENADYVTPTPGNVLYLGSDGTGRLTYERPSSNPTVIKTMAVVLADNSLLIVNYPGFGAGEPSEYNGGLVGKTFIPSARGMIQPYAQVGTTEYTSWQGDQPGVNGTDPSVCILGWYPPNPTIDPNNAINLPTIIASNVLYATESKFASADLSNPKKWISYNLNLEKDLFENVPSNATHALVSIRGTCTFRQSVSQSGRCSFYFGKYYAPDPFINFYDRATGVVSGMIDETSSLLRIRSFITQNFETTQAFSLSSEGIANVQPIDTVVCVPLTLVAGEPDDGTAYHMATILGQILEVSHLGLSFKVTGYYADLDATAFPNPYGDLRNKIINGNFAVAQRGLTISSVIDDTVVTLDRWNFNQLTSGHLETVITRRDATLADIAQGLDSSVKHYMRLSLTANSTDSNELMELVQFIPNLQSLPNGTATLSFWARTSAPSATVASVFSRHYNTTPNEGGAADADFSLIDLSLLSTTWQQYAIAFDLPEIAAMAATGRNALRFVLACGADFNAVSYDTTLPQYHTDLLGLSSLELGTLSIDIANVQLEEGGRNTRFENPDPMRQLHDCMAYFQKSYDQAYIPGAANTKGMETCAGQRSTVRFPLPMANWNGSDPSITLYAGDGTIGYGDSISDTKISLTASKIGTSGFVVTNGAIDTIMTDGDGLNDLTEVVSILKNSNVLFHWTANKEITF